MLIIFFLIFIIIIFHILWCCCLNFKKVEELQLIKNKFYLELYLKLLSEMKFNR